MSMINKGQVAEHSSTTLLARVVDDTGADITQAGTASIVVKVYDTLTGTQVHSATMDKTQCVFNTLQTDSRWDADATGYNLALPLDGSCFPSGDTTYRVEVCITPVGGDAFYLLWDLQSVGVYSS